VNSGSPWDTTTGGFKSTTGLSIALSAGMYWIAYLALTAAPTLNCNNIAVPSVGVPQPGIPSNQNAQNLRDSTGSRTSLPTDVAAYAFEAATQVPTFYLES
jgi:hypothetical protein